MSDHNDDRYNEILRRIQQRQQQAAGGPHQDVLSGVMDSLNALGFLEDYHWRHRQGIVCFGPKSFRGLGPPIWVCAALWFKSSNYYEHETLGLLGIWAISGEPVTVAVGVKTLPFQAPYYSPEAVYHSLKRGFETYYAGDATPPPEADWRYHAAYDPARRLMIRRELEAVLEAWAYESP